MKFDEAIEHFRNNTDISGTAVLLDDVEDTLKELREEYAPTIEMTKEQKRILDNYREPDLYDGDYVFNAFYDDTHSHRLSLRDTGLFDNITEKQLMQAWLHPETIKIVDE